jgi:hypothetical protein
MLVDCATIVREVVVTLAAGIGAVVAILGLKTWQNQFKGRTEYDLARRLLRAALGVRDRMRSVRNPFMSPEEIQEAMKAAGFTEEQMKQKILTPEANLAVYNARWRPLAEAVSDLHIESLEGEVIWGSAIHQRLRPLLDSVGKLRLALFRYLRIEAGIRPQPTGDKMDEIDAVVYDASDPGNEDKFTKDVNEAIRMIEEYVKPKLHL